MQCYVYKGDKKEDHFLFLPQEYNTENPPEEIPAGLIEMLGDLALVVDFDLLDTRGLPNADAKEVIEALSDRGFYIQMPKDRMHDNEELYFN